MPSTACQMSYVLAGALLSATATGRRRLRPHLLGRARCRPAAAAAFSRCWPGIGAIIADRRATGNVLLDAPALAPPTRGLHRLHDAWARHRRAAGTACSSPGCVAGPAGRAAELTGAPRSSSCSAAHLPAALRAAAGAPAYGQTRALAGVARPCGGLRGRAAACLWRVPFFLSGAWCGARGWRRRAGRGRREGRARGGGGEVAPGRALQVWGWEGRAGPQGAGRTARGGTARPASGRHDEEVKGQDEI